MSYSIDLKRILLHLSASKLKGKFQNLIGFRRFDSFEEKFVPGVEERRLSS